MSNFAGVGNTLAGSKTTPGSIAYNQANWNTQPLTGEWNDNMQNAATTAAGAMDPGGYLSQATGQVQNAATYDPAKFQQFLNPYTGAAADATTNAVNRNLTENIIPGLNSTFVGSGQFGSDRNEDFMSRAVRDTQGQLAEKLGTLNYGAAKDAQTATADWANRGITAGMDTAQLGQQNLTNLNTTGKGYLDWQTQDRQANYNDYLKQLQYPIEGMGALSTMAGSLKGAVQPNQSMTPGEMTGLQKAAIIAQMMGSATATPTGGTSALDNIKATWDWLQTKL